VDLSVEEYIYLADGPDVTQYAVNWPSTMWNCRKILGEARYFSLIGQSSFRNIVLLEAMKKMCEVE